MMTQSYPSFQVRFELVSSHCVVQIYIQNPVEHPGNIFPKIVNNLDVWQGPDYVSDAFLQNVITSNKIIQQLQGWAKTRPIQILYHNSTLHYAIALNFGRNTTSFAFNTIWYNLASMLQCIVL